MPCRAMNLSFIQVFQVNAVGATSCRTCQRSAFQRWVSLHNGAVHELHHALHVCAKVPTHFVRIASGSHSNLCNCLEVLLPVIDGRRTVPLMYSGGRETEYLVQCNSTGHTSNVGDCFAHCIMLDTMHHFDGKLR